MKRIILAVMSLFFFSSFLSLNAQWAIVYGERAGDFAYSIQQTADGGYIVAGETSSFGAGEGDIWVLKLSSIGSIEWQRTYGGSNYDYARCIKQTSDGGYIVGGSTFSFGAGDKDFWILKLNSAGDIEWQRKYGGNEWDHVHSIQQTSDGGYIFAGCSSSFGAGAIDIWILKLSSAGDIEWQKTYGGSGDDKARSIQQTKDGGYIVSGHTRSFGAEEDDWGGGVDDDIWILKLSSEGDIEWQKTYGGSGDDRAQSIQKTIDGGYIVAGWTNSFGAAYGDDFWVLKLSSEGDIEWHKIYDGGNNSDRAYSIQQTDDEGYIVAGWTNSFDAAYGDDFWVIKLLSDGDIEWQKTYGGNYSPDYGRSIQQTSDGGYVIAGETRSWGVREEDIWILKLYSNGDMDPLCTFIRDSNAIVSYLSLSPEDTDIIPANTNISPQETDISAQDSDAKVYKMGSEQCTLILSASDGGTTAPEPSLYNYDIGSEITLRAISESEHQFNEWSGNVQTWNNPITITMDGNKSIKANFYKVEPYEPSSGRDYEEWGDGGEYEECFIATAAYGSSFHPYVRILRAFRDKYLMPSRLGSKIVDIYYKYSPFVANFIAKHKTLKVMVRINLLPLIAFCYSILHFGPVITSVVIFFIFIIPVFFVWRYKRKLGHRSKI
ncbi:MAG: hypothetical protein GTN73_07700 [Candidatus Aminicenantes bacterium]|nr:hypothetical protein [Candidatus Aminicenantes bacterium]